MCEYSSRALHALRNAGARHVHLVNILTEPAIRADLPRYTSLSTFPQLFIHQELIGGCDIILELLESGQLQRMIQEADRPPG